MDFRELQEESRVVTDEKIAVGALIIMSLTREEGLVLKPGKTERRKRLIIIGVDKERGLCYGSLLVNTNMNPQSEYSAEYLSAQYLLRREPHYESFLDYDSFVDCAEVISISYEKLLKGEYHGMLEEDDRKAIFNVLEHTKTLSTSMKKRFGIRRM